MRCLIFLCFGTAATAVLAQPCRQDSLSKIETAVTQLRADLLRVKVDEISTYVPAPAQAQLPRLKVALADAVDLELECAPAGEPVERMQARLAELLHANLPEKPVLAGESKGQDEPVGDVYGADLKIAVSTPVNAASIRAVEVSFGISCGVDTMLLLYERRGASWAPVLHWMSGPYDAPSGAFGDLFTYAVLPKDQKELRVAVAHGHPWCTSRFSGFDIDVLTPSTKADHAPRVVWHTERGYSRGDYNSKLRATADGFELRVNAPAFDFNAYERTVVYRYRVAKDCVTRVGPIATNVRGFVEEWLSMPWDEAKEVTASEAGEAMKEFHERIAQLDKDTKTYVSYTYGPVRRCAMKGQYEVEMDAEADGPQFFSIREGLAVYMMVGVSKVRDERCSGLDILKVR